MLDVGKLCQSARECLGWPYVSPGSNDRDGIDCSGLFVKAYRDQGASIYHGSNTIYRKYCRKTGRIESSAQLKPGMAVFKWKPKDQAKYPDGQGDFHHIGMVVSTYPLQIIHASSAKGHVTTDTSIGKWAYWGELKDVDYGKGEEEMIPSEPELLNEPDDNPIRDPIYATVTATSGETVNLRQKPSKSAPLVDRIKTGERVEYLKDDGEWAYIRYGNEKGYMMCMFLEPEDDLDGNDPGDRDVTVVIEHLTEEEADEIIRQYPKGIKQYG